MNNANLDWRIVMVGAVALAIAGGAAVARIFRRAPDPGEAERRRRAHLNQIGRIVDGRIVDFVEIPPDAAPASGFASRSNEASARAEANRKLLWYTYSISGVSYETTQDVTDLEAQRGLERVIAGQPASIKYDPSNPSDSILIADDWSGLR